MIPTLDEADASLWERSLLTIVQVCISMIFLCAWVTVHRNIPQPEIFRLKMLWGRLKMLFWVVVAPELVLAWAARQYVAAKEIAKVYNDHHVQPPVRWTTTHGHFLIMGGFILVEPSDSTPHEKTRVLSFEIFLRLVRDNQLNGTITEITEDEIMDRSKNDVLSRSFAILHALWFIVQCIARHMQHLPLTEFELLTLALTSVSGVMYIFWWYKPREVRVPMRVYLNKKLATNQANPERPGETTNEDSGNEITELSRHAPKTSPIPQHSAEVVQAGKGEENDELQAPKSIFTFSAKQVKSSSAGFLKSLKCIVIDKLWDSEQDGFVAHFLQLSHGIYLIPAYLLFLVFFLPIFTLLFIFASMSDIINTVNVSPTATKVPTFYAPRIDNERIQFVVSAVIGLVYGGFHCMAWNFVFPTRADQMFWRTASVAITVLPLLSMLIGLIRELSKENTLPQIKSKDREIEKRILDIIEVLSTIILIVLFFVHVSARLLLFAHAIWLLRKQPAEVYHTVDWTLFIPHVL